MNHLQLLIALSKKTFNPMIKIISIEFLNEIVIIKLNSMIQGFLSIEIQ